MLLDLMTQYKHVAYISNYMTSCFFCRCVPCELLKGLEHVSWRQAVRLLPLISLHSGHQQERRLCSFKVWKTY